MLLAGGWMSFVAPLRTTPPIVEPLNRELNKALADPGFIQRLRDVGLQPDAIDGGGFRRFHQARHGAVG